MTNSKTYYPAGHILILTEGECEEIEVIGCYITIKEVRLDKLAQEAANGKTAYKDEDADPVNFPAWLIKNGYIKQLKADEIRVGGYGRWNKDLGVSLSEED